MSDEEASGSTSAAEQAPGPASTGSEEARGLNQPWVRFALTFSLLVAVTEALYHTVALDSHAFFLFLRGLAQASGAVLTPFYERVSVTAARVATEDFVVTVDYGCDGLQVCTLLSAAVIAFPSTIKQKLAGLVLGNLWLQSWNVVRIASLVVVGGIRREIFGTVHVYVWPTVLVAVCLGTWMAWARWTMRDDELAA